MSIEEFREKLKNNRTLKVASRAFDRTFSPKNLIEDYWKIFLIAYAIGAIYVISNVGQTLNLQSLMP